MYLRRSFSGHLRRIFRFPSGPPVATITSPASSNIWRRAPPLPPLQPNVRSSSYMIQGFSSRKSYGSDWFMVYAQAVFLGICSHPVFAEGKSAESIPENEDPVGAEVVGLRRVDDGSVVSNEHTMKWRIFTDNGRDSFQKGKLADAEKFFISALREAKEGFGGRDAHVASACNNLAELYRVMKAFDKAEPLYMEAVNILEDSFGPEDIRVGVAFHNLGQFYLGQRKFEDASSCYERALKIKGRVLGYSHADYADTMYHLGTVLNLQGKEKESEALIVDSIRILEEGGQGQSSLYMRRLRHLAQMYLKSHRLVDAENVQRKILHALELVKGWAALETAMEADRLAQTLQSAGKLREAHELLGRCLDARKSLLPDDHIQTGANMLRPAKVAILYSNQQSKTSTVEATIQLDKAKGLLENCIRIAQQVLRKSMKRKTLFRNEDSAESIRNVRLAMIILMQSFDALGLLENTRQELQHSREGSSGANEAAANAFVGCIEAYKEFGREGPISGSVEVRTEYLSCLGHLLSLLTDAPQSAKNSQKITPQELKDEISRVETEVSAMKSRGEHSSACFPSICATDMPG